MYDVINKKGFSLAIGHLEESRDWHKAAGNYHGEQPIFTVHASKTKEFNANNAWNRDGQIYPMILSVTSHK